MQRWLLSYGALPDNLVSLRCVMPIYTYRCENCGVQFDRQQKFSDPVLTRCPECNKKTLRKVYQPVGIVFKGSGFYATDHRSPSGSHHSNSHKSEGESKSSSESSDGGSTAGEDKSKSSESSSSANKKSDSGE
jgi:putative FmdB family regulatory protein